MKREIKIILTNRSRFEIHKSPNLHLTNTYQCKRKNIISHSTLKDDDGKENIKKLIEKFDN